MILNQSKPEWVMPEKRRVREKESLNVLCASQQQWCVKNPNTLLPHTPPKKPQPKFILAMDIFGFTWKEGGLILVACF